ncbi:MAG: archaellin/type IV pilin N-terminal domain-containing protein [Desulfurococcaceae archaeon]
MARRKAISPVIATVIIVAVTIAVAIAVAFWMTGIIGLFTGFEQLQITSIIDTDQDIQVTVRNTGTATATITDVYINGRPCITGRQQPACNINPNPPIALQPGASQVITIEITDQNAFGAQIGPGVSLEVKLLTASGKEYPKLIVLQQYTPQQPEQQQQEPGGGGSG